MELHRRSCHRLTCPILTITERRIFYVSNLLQRRCYGPDNCQCVELRFRLYELSSSGTKSRKSQTFTLDPFRSPARSRGPGGMEVPPQTQKIYLRRSCVSRGTRTLVESLPHGEALIATGRVKEIQTWERDLCVIEISLNWFCSRFCSPQKPLLSDTCIPSTPTNFTVCPVSPCKVFVVAWRS